MDEQILNSQQQIPIFLIGPKLFCCCFLASKQTLNQSESFRVQIYGFGIRDVVKRSL